MVPRNEKIKNIFYSGQFESVTWEGGLGLRTKGSLKDARWKAQEGRERGSYRGRRLGSRM